MRLIAILGIIIVLAASSAPAAIIYAENFDTGATTEGQLVSAAPLGWANDGSDLRVYSNLHPGWTSRAIDGSTSQYWGGLTWKDVPNPVRKDWANLDVVSPAYNLSMKVWVEPTTFACAVGFATTAASSSPDLSWEYYGDKWVFDARYICNNMTAPGPGWVEFPDDGTMRGRTVTAKIFVDPINHQVWGTLENGTVTWTTPKVNAYASRERELSYIATYQRQDLGAGCMDIDDIRLDDGTRPSFGKNWLRNHPFQIYGLSIKYCDYVYNSGTLDTYRNAMSSAWVQVNDTLAPSKIALAEAAGMQWIAYLPYYDITYEVRGYINSVSSPTDDTAWYMGDEPYESQLTTLPRLASWLQQNRPNGLIHFAWADFQLTNTYIPTTMANIKPDILMYDIYPFHPAGVSLWRFFNGDLDHPNPYGTQGLKGMRFLSELYKVPWWSWMQTFTETAYPRMPSDSETRMQLFASLAAGCKGFGYMCYDSNTVNVGIIPLDGVPASKYNEVLDANQEVMNLGKCLRMLESTDLRYVKGDPSHDANAMPLWTAGAGGDTHITNIAVTAPSGATYKDALVGFFTDDAGEIYFMLTNMYQGMTLLASQAQTSFTITFDSSVNSVLRLNRETGLEEVLNLNNHVLSFTLPGGTGDLFKYNTGRHFDMGTRPVTGNFIIQDYLGSPADIPVSVELRKKGRQNNFTFNRTINPDTSGNFTIDNVDLGSYDIYFKGPNWLRKAVNGVTVQ